jgi:uncharacterized protein YecE (DUF72 family)
MAGPASGLDTVYLSSPPADASVGVKPLIEQPFASPSRAAACNDGAALQEEASLARQRCAFVGTAGWSVPSQYNAAFCAIGSHLERYATRLNAAEINSSFYRSHRRQTYERWAGSVPGHFRFAVKIPKEITHERRLIDSEAQLDRLVSEVSGLGAHLGVLLVQLPPSLALELASANKFFGALGTRIDKRVAVACEPRHCSWFTEEGEALLRAHDVARVAADPPRADNDGQPGGSPDLNYYRLHGSPQMYYSNYDAAALERLRRTLAASIAAARATWCIFDNTAAFAALGNALAVGAHRSVSAYVGSQ